MGNMQHPFSPAQVAKAIAELPDNRLTTEGSFSSTMEIHEGDSGLPITSLFCSAASSLHPEPLGMPEAVKTGIQTSPLEFVHQATPVPELLPAEETLVALDEEYSSVEDFKEEEKAKAVKIEEVNKFLSFGVVSKARHDRLELFTAKAPSPKHVLRPEC